MHAGILIGYFGKEEEARKAFSLFRQKGFRRAACGSKNPEGGIHLRDPFRARFAIGTAAAFVVFGLLASVAWLARESLGISPDSPALVWFLGGGGAGALVFLSWMRRSRFGVGRQLLENHARWLVSGESVLIFEGAIETLGDPVALLLGSSEAQPAVFILYPEHESPPGEQRTRSPRITPSQLADHAQSLAVNHRNILGPCRNTVLIKRIERGRLWVHETCLDLTVAGALEQSVSPVAEWLLDNEYLLEGTARKILLNLPRRYYRQLPALTSEPDAGLPRIYDLARELISHLDLRLDQDNILAFVAAYQTELPLSIGELWALPQMLRTVLLEGIQQIARRTQTEVRERAIADFWANRLIAVNRRDPPKIFSVLAELAKTQPAPSAYFASQLIDALYDEEAALAPVQRWLERKFQRPLSEINLREKSRQTKDHISIGDAFTSLRKLDLLDWKVCFESLSQVEGILRQDPAGIYARMDFNTRDRCRRAIEDLRRGSSVPEQVIAQRVLELARRASLAPDRDDRSRHVGTYLIGEGRGGLARAIGCREAVRFRVLRWTYRHHAAMYFGLNAALTLSLVWIFAWFGSGPESFQARILLGLLLLLPASQLSQELVNYLVMRLLPPATLPKMDYQTSGIPDACRTLIVIPVMLVDAETIRDEVEKLEIRYLANTEDNLVFGLFSDHADASQLNCDEDAALLQTASAGVTNLNARHGADRFFLFHRERQWSESEQRFIGWERKRGKLEELNGLIDGTRAHDAERILHVGNPDHLSDIQFVITLDSDTQLPSGTARRLIETLAHPLNRVRFDHENRVLSGYTIIQPRVSPSLPSTSGSPFSRLFSDPVGIDPYTNAVSDVNQDLAGEGSYHGKGIYDVRAFSRVLAGRFPEGRLLSHDLIEGAYVRVGLASDIELYDEFPQDYLSFIRRQHRWMRGDWQIAGWILPEVPRQGGGRVPNPLSWFNRGKIFDNLRRSLLPVASLSLLLASWLVSVPAGFAASAAVGAQLLFKPLTQPFTWATSSSGSRGLSLVQLAHDLLRILVEAAMLPYQAWLSVDAIVRVEYRRHVSHRGLLEWASARSIGGNATARKPMFLFSLCLVSVFSLFAGWQVHSWGTVNLTIAGPWLAVWLLSPVVGWLLIRRPQPTQPQSHLQESDRRFLRSVACRTWRYFSDFVNDKSSWLPPDNFQVSYQNQLAMRTSPTNIGLWMVSVLGAHEFGYVTVDDAVGKLTSTMETIGKLDRHEGHLLNWYDIQTLIPLKPRYVSTVDSGNLLGALWSLDHGLEGVLDAPLLDTRAFAGLWDVADALRQAAAREKRTDLQRKMVDTLLNTWDNPPVGIVDMLRVLRQARQSAGDLADVPENSPPTEASVAYWAHKMQSQMEAWLNIADRYLPWVEILGEKSADEVAALDPAAVQAFRQALLEAPSLRGLASGELPWVAAFQTMRTGLEPQGPAGTAWIDRVFQSLEKSKWLGGEMLASCQRLSGAGRALANSMNMRFLYSADRRLFSIGYNVAEGRLDHAYYDLLASEARLGSFIAIARGEIPAEHWFVMSRPYGAVGNRRVLLSWTGTMFEYLMPLLFQRSYEHSLLDKAAREAVAVQIVHGRIHHVPWGISESACGDLDINKTYQYNAFGVPELGLKRGLAERTVVAPYATLLALNIAPRAGLRNLRRLAGLGLLGNYGYFDAMDFSQQPTREGERGGIVRTYMAHHVGMGFLALTNLLHDNSIQNHFHGDPRVRAVEPLLHERIPYLPPLNQVTTRPRVSSIAAIGEEAPSVSQFDTPHTATPKTQILSNGRYRLMVTNAGGGYSQWGDVDVTRWRSDRTADSWGTFCYLRDVDADRLWCNTYQPTGGKVDGYSVDFSLDRAVFRRNDQGMTCETEVVVAPEDDVEIRRMTLINHSLRTIRLDLTSYVELSLAAHNADRQHPAFNKLFIETDALPAERVLLASRRPRNADDRPIVVAHRFTLEPGDDEAFRFETDRARFVGRGQTLLRPMGAVQNPGNTAGYVLDPILSLRQSLTLRPGQRAQLSMVLACAATREHAVGLMTKYGDPRAIDRAMDSAWASAQLELRLLRIQPDEARRFQELASHLLFPNTFLRAPAERIAANRKGQASLWTYGISGDLPIALVTIGEAEDLSLVRQMLQAHTYWRMHGFTTDLVILNEEPSGYERPLQEQLERLIQSHWARMGVDRPGGIYVRIASLIPEEDLTLLRTVAGVVVVAARGNLPQQLAKSLDAPEVPGPITLKREMRVASAALPFMELSYFNSIGGFTPDGREYAIYLGPGINTPMPWVNVLANPGFGTIVSETGAGFTWQGDSQQNRLTQWSNDPVTDPPSEALYIRDEETGVYWTPCASPIREEGAYRARFGAGYAVYEHNSHGVEQELTVFVPVDERGGEPLKLQSLLLKNDSGRPRKLSVTYYVEWTLGEFRESSQSHVVTHWDDESEAIIARNAYHATYGDRVAFAAISQPVTTYTGDRTAFLGRNRSMGKPAGMARSGLSRRTGAGLDPCAGLQTVVRLAPGEEVTLTCIMGQSPSVQEARTFVLAYRDDAAVAAKLKETKSWWDDRLDVVQVHTPERAVDLILNRWLLYQTLVCRLWGRSGFYQSGGAFGFRDQLQDVMALVYAQPGLAREHILLAAGRQFTEGDVQHWWHMPGGAGIRSRISDDLLWLPYVVAHYVRITGDVAILDQQVGFLEAPILEPTQHESFQTPVPSTERASLFEHCQRSIARGRTSGPHGLPLIGTGDWNDGMNLVGAAGTGESVWLGWFLADVLNGMGDISEYLGRSDLSLSYRKDRTDLIEHIEQFAWDGEWYLRATFDDGTSLGSSANGEARIDSLPQSWAWLSGAAQPDRALRALDAAWKHLVREEDGLVLLFEPPFDTSMPSPGYIKGYPPGVRENGGQYTHAALWLAMAMARSGDGTRASTMMRMLNPIERARDPEAVWRYGIEPYVVAADVYLLPGRIGKGGWSWYTGSAALMYRAWLEEILGLHVRGETLRIVPVIPGAWDGFQIIYRNGEAVYDISVQNPDHCERDVAWVELDGQRMGSGSIPLSRDFVKHRIVVRMGMTRASGP